MKDRSTLPASLLAGGLLLALPPGSGTARAQAENQQPPGDSAEEQHRPIQPHAPRQPSRSPGQWAELPGELRTIDGTGNNRNHPLRGSANQFLRREVRSDYGDGTATPAGEDRPSARSISNAISAQSGSILNKRNATDFLWQWGQFLDHDIDATPESDPPEPFNIPVPTGDPQFDPMNSGTVEIPLNRSHGESVDGVREQVNAITAFIDASNVYGSDEDRANALRTRDGSGRLRTTPSSTGDLLPYNTDRLPNAMSDSPAFFLAGDVRANEQVGLTAMHTLFVREHNFWADRYADLNPGIDGDEIYGFARMMVGAELQAITYREFLPVLLGRNALPLYRGYQPQIDPSISNLFATVAYRMGHSLLSSTLLRLDAEGEEIAGGHLPLAAAFFHPTETEVHGIDPTLRGLATQQCQELDGKLVDDVRNMLFGPPGSGGMDLAALNIQRGRDHGIPSFVETCRGMGLRPARRFRDLNPDPAIWRPMRKVYGEVRLVDAWVGGLCEPHAPGAMVGPMMREVLVDQFTRLRDGDRFYYERHLPRPLARLVEAQSLARIIRRNTGIGRELQENVFLKPRPRLRRPWWWPRDRW